MSKKKIVSEEFVDCWPQLKVLDCTIRDGGLMNNHMFSDDFVRFVHKALVAAGVDYMEVGYKIFRSEVIKSIKLSCMRFEFEHEVAAKVLRLGYSIYEVAISYTTRSRDQGKKINWKDGVKAVYFLIKYRFTRMDKIRN